MLETPWLVKQMQTSPAANPVSQAQDISPALKWKKASQALFLLLVKRWKFVDL